MVFGFILCSTLFSVKAQEINVIEGDTLRLTEADSAIINNSVQAADTLFTEELTTDTIPVFKPNPKRAVIYSAIFPGLGQVYNRKYWKLPLVYGGFMGFAYAILWNNKNFKDYSEAYFDIMFDDPNDPDSWHDSWMDFVPAGREPSEYINDGSFKNRLKNGKDYYRRYRDLSYILTIAWYFICMADTYVDAQLFDFDISADLSMHIAPSLTPRTKFNSNLYGLSLNIKF
jgi:hypothetical protein